MNKQKMYAIGIGCLGIIGVLSVGNASKTVENDYLQASKNEVAKKAAESEIENKTEEIEEIEEIEEKTTEINTISPEEIMTTKEVPEEINDIHEQEDEYTNFAIADVDNYVNVRNEPSTDGEIVGKIYDGAVAEVIEKAGEQDDWFKITSGNVEGYIKSEFFLYGEEAAQVMEQYVTKYAQVKADRLNVREEQSTESKRIGYVDNGEKIRLLEDCGEWIKVQYAEQKEGYVSSQYITILEEYTYAKTLEEEQAEIAEKEALAARENVAEQEVPEIITNIEFPDTLYTSNEELRSNIVDYALQYVGNRYVSGGSSLAGGTDCSGFTCFIYADFGYSISRTPQGQYTGAGRSIDYSEIQPGDIICYCSNGTGRCTHVALYIGNGQIVHEANSRKGVIVGAADYDHIIGIKNVID